MTSIAVMQPYFLPYAGYFRLMAATDLFVIYDCVQFPRRGWVHRNRLADASGTLRWLTLPLDQPPWQARIDSIRLAADAPERLAAAMRYFPCLRTPAGAELATTLLMEDCGGSPLLPDYLERQLRAIAERLRIGTPFLRSSTLDLGENLRAQDRILAICERLGATRYVNAPGGTDLYDPAAFAERGIELNFLPSWQGPSDSILQRLAEEGAEACGTSIRIQCATVAK